MGFGQVLTKVLQVLANGVPTFYLEGVSYEGRCWTEKFEIWPGPENPKKVPRGPRSPPGPAKSSKNIFGARARVAGHFKCFDYPVTYF